MRAECFSTEDYIWRMAIVIVIATFSQSFERCVLVPGTRYPYTWPGTGIDTTPGQVRVLVVVPGSTSITVLVCRFCYLISIIFRSIARIAIFFDI